MPKPEQIRARVWGKRKSMIVSRKGWSPRPREFWTHWYMEVTDGEKIIHADDCRDLGKLLDEASQSVASFRVLAQQGHTFRSWRELVDEARA